MRRSCRVAFQAINDLEECLWLWMKIERSVNGIERMKFTMKEIETSQITHIHILILILFSFFFILFCERSKRTHDDSNKRQFSTTFGCHWVCASDYAVNRLLMQNLQLPLFPPLPLNVTFSSSLNQKNSKRVFFLFCETFVLNP